MEAAVVMLCCGIGGRVMQLNRQWRQKKAPGRQTGRAGPHRRAPTRLAEAGSELRTVSVCPLSRCGLAG